MPRTTSRASGGAGTLPRLVTVDEAATLLAVDKQTIYNWVDEEAIPYVELPARKRRRIRIPLQGLLNTLGGNYDLAAELQALVDAAPSGTSLRDLLAGSRADRLPHTGDGPVRVESDDPGEDLWNLAQGRGPHQKNG